MGWWQIVEGWAVKRVSSSRHLPGLVFLCGLDGDGWQVKKKTHPTQPMILEGPRRPSWPVKVPVRSAVICALVWLSSPAPLFQKYL